MPTTEVTIAFNITESSSPGKGNSPPLALPCDIINAFRAELLFVSLIDAD